MKLRLKIKTTYNEQHEYLEARIFQIQLRDDNGEYISALKFTQELIDYITSHDIPIDWAEAQKIDQNANEKKLAKNT